MQKPKIKSPEPKGNAEAFFSRPLSAELQVCILSTGDTDTPMRARAFVKAIKRISSPNPFVKYPPKPGIKSASHCPPKAAKAPARVYESKRPALYNQIPARLNFARSPKAAQTKGLHINAQWREAAKLKENTAMKPINSNGFIVSATLAIWCI